jgi:hypothetical protein
MSVNSLRVKHGNREGDRCLPSRRGCAAGWREVTLTLYYSLVIGDLLNS